MTDDMNGKDDDTTAGFIHGEDRIGFRRFPVLSDSLGPTAASESRGVTIRLPAEDGEEPFARVLAWDPSGFHR